MIRLSKKYGLLFIFLLFTVLVSASASMADVIIDNGGAGTSYTGTWYLSGGTTPYGPTSLWSRDGTKYTFTMSGQPAGTYEVLMWWSGYYSRPSSVPVAINYTGGTSNITVNQKENSGQWNSLGTFYFNGSGSVTITAVTGSTYATCADAVQFRLVSSNAAPVAVIDSIAPSPAGVGENVTFTGHGTDSDGTVTAYEWVSSINGTISTAESFSTTTLSSGTHTISFRVKDSSDVWSPAATAQLVVGTPSVEVIIDNGQTGTSYTGTWYVSGGTSPYGTNSLWSRDGTKYTFTMSGQPAGTYEVSMWWSGYSTRPSSVPVAINYTGGTSNITVNQKENSGQWNSLGTFYFNGSGSVTITAVTGSTYATCADAVKFTLVSTNQAPQATIDSISPNPADQGQSVTFTGHGTDSDGTIAGYEWTSSRDGALGSAAAFSTSTLSAGTHTISLRVKDNLGAWSTAVTSSLVVNTTANVPPAAVIDSIAPNPASSGQTVTFTGHGTDSDGTVTAYQWSSSIDGIIGTAASFSSSTLSVGTHTITFKVMDNASAWSNAVTSSVMIGGASPSEVIIDNTSAQTSRTGTWSTSSGSGYYGTNSLYSSDGTTFTWKFTPAATGYYEVFMWWTVHSTRSSAIPVSITHSGGTQVATINQLQNGGQWNSLGTYGFTAGMTYNITITSQPSSTTTCADAVKFSPASLSAPTADFSASITSGTGPLTVQFTDKSLGVVTSWLWDFGDGGTSAERNPSHTYATSGTFTVSLTATNDAGSNTKTKSGYIQVTTPSAGEHIYIGDGYSKDAVFVNNVKIILRNLGATQVGDTWVYRNKSTGKTFVFHFVNTPAGFMSALKQEGAHIIWNGHSNFGLGGSFAQGNEVYAQQIDAIRYIDDDRFTHVSTPMVSVKIDGVQYGQAYPNWLPIFKNGTSGIMPYTFAEGLPPYNYYLTYRVPGDPTLYRVELSDGSYLERFPDSGVPAWYSPSGLAPSPTENPEYFIVNDDPDYNRCDFVGTWPVAKEADDVVEYSAYNYQYHAAGTGSNSATWTLVVRYAGYYQVTATWQSASTNASNATYTIEHDGGTTTVVADQRVKTLGYPLGTYYFSPGSYKVRLTDKANGRVVADSMRLSSVDGFADRLQAEFSAAALTGTAPLTVVFKDLSEISSSTGGTIASWFWDFGDGSTSTLQNPTHIYSQAGTYTVALTVTSSTGAQDTEIKTGVIHVGSTGALRALFAADTRNVTTRTSVQFTDMSSGSIKSWLWDFGDGNTSTEQNPVYRFRTTGTFTVSLTVQSSSGTDTITNAGYVQSVRSAYTVIADNAYHFKPHFFDRSGSYGKTILYGNTAITESELKYSRMFYSSCNSCNYYVGNFHRGIMYCTTSDSDMYTGLQYIQAYIAGQSDDAILRLLNTYQDIHELINFNLKPPSLR